LISTKASFCAVSVKGLGEWSARFAMRMASRLRDAKEISCLLRRATTSKGVYTDVHDRREEERNTGRREINEHTGP
jgi:hypothetical protein